MGHRRGPIGQAGGLRDLSEFVASRFGIAAPQQQLGAQRIRIDIAGVGIEKLDDRRLGGAERAAVGQTVDQCKAWPAHLSTLGRS